MFSTDDNLTYYAFTDDYLVILTEEDDKATYGIYNKNTHVIEMYESVFPNTIAMIIEMQLAYDQSNGLIDDSGRIKMSKINTAMLDKDEENVH